MHRTVLLKEAVNSLKIDELLDSDGKSVVVDCTFGRGGHSLEILKKLKVKRADGKVDLIAFDKDPDAIKYARDHFRDRCFKVIDGGFEDLREKLAEIGIFEVDGILVDLGLCSGQLEDADRGFSFRREGILDMRMDNRSGVTALDVIRGSNYESLERIIKEYGEERHSERITAAIIKERDNIQTTTCLANLCKVELNCFYRDKKIHPATKVFQALRIYVNKEIQALEKLLPQAFRILKPSRTLSVITFHSLEGRIVEKYFRRFKAKCSMRKVLPSKREVRMNPRARSAILRSIRKG